MTWKRGTLPIRSRRWLVLAVICALVFVADLIAVEAGATRAVDDSLDRSLHHTFGRSSYGFFELMSAVGGGGVRVVIIVLIVLVLLIARYWWSAALTMVATGGAALLFNLVKVLVGRPRPRLFPHVVSAGGSSFPSGHATDNCCLALVCLYLVWHISRNRRLTGVAAIVLVSYVALVGLSRVVLGVHYPTDVVGGYALGAAWTALVTAVFVPALATEKRGSEARVHAGRGTTT